MRNLLRSFVNLVLLLLMQLVAFLSAPILLPTTDVRADSAIVLSGNIDIALVNAIDTSIWSPPSPDPVGIVYHPGFQRLIISDSEVEEMPIYQDANLFQASTDGTLLTTCRSPSFSNEPTGITFDPFTGYLYLSDDWRNEVYQIDLGDDGQFCTSDDTWTAIDTEAFGALDPEGLTFAEGKLFIADGWEADIFVLSPGLNEIFDGVPPSGDDTVTKFDTAVYDMDNPKGIAYHHERGTLFIVSREEDSLLEVTLIGEFIKSYDISFSNIVDPSGVAIGPSSQGTGETAIYVTARGIDNDYDPNENDGKVYEFIFTKKLYLPSVYR